MSMKITYEGKKEFSVNIRNHRFTVDQPEDNDGDNNGPTPPEIFAASLGTCIGVYVASYCNGKGINCEGLAFYVNWKFSEEHDRIEKLSVEIVMPDESYKKREKAILKVAENCLIHNTLNNAPGISVGIKAKS